MWRLSHCGDESVRRLSFCGDESVRHLCVGGDESMRRLSLCGGRYDGDGCGDFIFAVTEDRGGSWKREGSTPGTLPEPSPPATVGGEG